MIPLKDITITTIAENAVSASGLIAEWGFAVYVKAGERTFLLDTGGSAATVSNAEALGIDLKRIEAVVLSHGHYDHTGGLPAVLKKAGKSSLPIIAHPDTLGQKYSYRKNSGEYRYAGTIYRREYLESLGGSFRFSREPVWLSEDIAACGEEPMTTDFEAVAENLFLKEGENFLPDPLADDQSVFIRTEAGLLVILGCAHRGMINIIRHGQKLMDTAHIFMVIGGTHLGPASGEQLEKTMEEIQRLDIEWIGVSHCTGLPAAAKLSTVFREKFFFNNVGTTIQFPSFGSKR